MAELAAADGATSGTRAERAAAAAEERARLARAVHDGVLQVLALVQRRGAELGRGRRPSWAGWPASRRRAARADPPAGRRRAPCRPGDLDLAAELARLAAVRPGRASAAPGRAGAAAGRGRGRAGRGGRGLPGQRRAATSGDDAPAWVLLEELPDRVEVTRARRGAGDPRGPAGRRPAARAGSASASRSAAGCADLGGTATLATGSFGTEWELSVPRPPPAGRPAAVRSPGDHPRRAPVPRPRPRPGPAVARPARRRGHPVDGRRGTRRARG